MENNKAKRGIICTPMFIAVIYAKAKTMENNKAKKLNNKTIISGR